MKDYGRLEKSVCMKCGIEFRVVDKAPQWGDAELEHGRCPERGCGRQFWHSKGSLNRAYCYVVHA